MSKTEWEQKCLDYHIGGKTGTLLKKPCDTAEELSMAYTPGVAIPCKEIEKDVSLAYKYTNKGNLVAVVTDGEKVTSLQQGDVVGEISTSGLSSPVADVIAEVDVEVLGFPIEEINEVAFEYEDFAVLLREIGMQRIEPSNA